MPCYLQKFSNTWKVPWQWKANSNQAHGSETSDTEVMEVTLVLWTETKTPLTQQPNIALEVYNDEFQFIKVTQQLQKIENI